MKIPSVTRAQVKNLKKDLSYNKPQLSILKPMDSFYKRSQLPLNKQFSFTSINDAKPGDSGVFAGIKH
jgi:hypothetical protein